MTSSRFRTAAAAIALICCAGFASPSAAESAAGRDNLNSVPQLDMQPGCQAAASAGLDLATQPTLQSCLDAEQAGRQSLEKEWSTFPADERRSCVASIETGGAPSYVNLLWCLRDAAAARDIEKKSTAGNGTLSER